MIKELSESDFIKIRKAIAEDLDTKINTIMVKTIEDRLERWFETNLEQRFDKVIRDEISKILIVKLDR